LASIVFVVLLAPIWLDPTALLELTGPGPTPIPTPAATPQGPPEVVPAAPPAGQAPALIVVHDAFRRVSGEGWGISDLGGPYTPLDQGTDVSVGSGVGRMMLPTAGVERAAYLDERSFHDVDLRFAFSLDALPSDGAVYVYGVLRRTTIGAAYRPKIFVTPEGALYAHAGVMRQDGELSLGRSALVPGVTIRPGTWINVRATATGSDPTVLRVRAWSTSDDEPDYWNFGAIDWTGSLQGAGGVGVASYLGVRHLGESLGVQFDELIVTTTDLPMDDQ
jgi:hypothetical protein